MRHSNAESRPVRLLLIVVFTVAGLSLLYLQRQNSELQATQKFRELERAVLGGRFTTAAKLLAEEHAFSNNDDRFASVVVNVVEALLAQGNLELAARVVERRRDALAHPVKETLLVKCIGHAISKARPTIADQLFDCCARESEPMPSVLRMESRVRAMLFDDARLRDSIRRLDDAGAASAEDVAAFFPGDEIKWNDRGFLDWLTSAHRNEPDNLQVAAALIRMLPRFGRDEEAVTLVSQLESRSNECWQLSIVIAKRLYEQRSFEKAYGHLASAPPPASRSFEACLLGGRLLTCLGHEELARDFFRRASILDPTAPAPVLELHAPDEQATVEILEMQSQYAELANVLRSGDTLSPSANMELVETLRGLKIYRAAEIVLGDTASSGNSLPQVPLYPWPTVSIAPSKASPRASAVEPVAALAFKDVTHDIGLDFRDSGPPPQADVLLTSLGSGCASIDFDNDLWPDLYFAQGVRNPGTSEDRTSDVLIRNVRGHCTDVTDVANVHEFRLSHGVCLGDYNEDGFTDIYICNYGTNTLLQNLGDGTFQVQNELILPAPDGWSTGAVFVDVDADRDLDLYVAQYVTTTYEEQVLCAGTPGQQCRPNDFPSAADLFFENLGNGTFGDRSDRVSMFRGNGLGVTLLPGQGNAPRIFVGNDATPNFLWVPHTSDHELHFSETAYIAGVAVGANGYSQACMGIATADVNADGTTDLLVTNYEFEPASLYVSSGELFTEAASHFNLAASSFPRLSWGAQFIDADNNAFADLVVLNGHLFDRPMATDVYRATADQRFERPDFSPLEGYPQQSMGRANLRLDWNRDGRLDLVTTAIDGPARLLLNSADCSRGNTARIISRNTTRCGIGTETRLIRDDRAVGWQRPFESGYMTTNARDIVFPQHCQLEIVSPNTLVRSLTTEQPHHTILVITDSGDAR